EERDIVRRGAHRVRDRRLSPALPARGHRLHRPHARKEGRDRALREPPMSATKTLLILPRDGIGPAVIRQVQRIVEWFNRRGPIAFEMIERPVGGEAIDRHGVPITDETVALAHRVDAVLYGAAGGPKWDGLEFSKRPERALLRLRKEMDLFANLRLIQ